MACVGFVESSISGLAIAAMRAARERGHRVAFFSRDPAYYSGAFDPAVLAVVADEVIVHETNDARSVLAAVASIEGPVDALISIGEFYTVQVAEAARRLGLPGLAVDAALTARSKLRTRQRCKAAGLRVPAFHAVETADAAVDAARSVGLPCVVKPVDGTASMQVLRCSSDAQVRAAAAAIRRQRFNGRGQACERTILVEEYLLGHEVSVESVTRDGVTHVVGVTDKHLSGPPHFVEMGHVFPSGLPTSMSRACTEVAVSALAAIGFDFGVAHTEVRLAADGPVLIEINARPPGDHITDLVRHAHGIDLLTVLIDAHLGDRGVPRRTRDQAAAVRFFDASPGLVTWVGGTELAARIPGVTELRVAAGPGSRVGPLRSSKDRLGQVIAVAPTPYLADRLAQTALGQVQIVTVPEAPDRRTAGP